MALQWLSAPPPRAGPPPPPPPHLVTVEIRAPEGGCPLAALRQHNAGREPDSRTTDSSPCMQRPWDGEPALGVPVHGLESLTNHGLESLGSGGSEYAAAAAAAMGRSPSLERSFVFVCGRCRAPAFEKRAAFRAGRRLHFGSAAPSASLVTRAVVRPFFESVDCFGLRRDEVLCGCGAHLGWLYPGEGPLVVRDSNSMDSNGMDSGGAAATHLPRYSVKRSAVRKAFRAMPPQTADPGLSAEAAREGAYWAQVT